MTLRCDRVLAYTVLAVRSEVFAGGCGATMACNARSRATPIRS